MCSDRVSGGQMGLEFAWVAIFHPRGTMDEKDGVYLADKGITGGAIANVNKTGKIAWFKNYDIPVVPELKEVAAAPSQVKAANA